MPPNGGGTAGGRSILWVRPDATANPRILQVFYTIDRNYNAPYFKVASPPGSPDTIGLEVFDGTTIYRSYAPQNLRLVREHWYPTIMRWTPGQLVFHCHADGLGCSVNFPSAPWTSRTFVSQYLGGDGLPGTPGVALGVYRAWIGIPFLADEYAMMWNELASLEPYWDTSIPKPPNTCFVDTPLHADLQDHSVNARHWVAVGSPVVTSGLDWGTVSPLVYDDTGYINGFEFGNNGQRPYPGGTHATGCGGAMVHGCNGALERQLDTGGRGPVRGAAQLDFQGRVAAPYGLTRAANVLFVYDHFNPVMLQYPAPGPGSLNVTNIVAFAYGDGSITITCQNTTVRSAPGLIPFDGVTTVGLQFLWDLSGANPVVQAYVNNVLVLTCTGAGPLVTKTWNYVVFGASRSFNNVSSPYYSLTTVISKLAIYSTTVLGDRHGCVGARLLGMDQNCCYEMQVALPTSITGDPATNTLTVHGLGFQDPMNVQIQGPEAAFVYGSATSVSPTEIVLTDLDPPLQAGGTYCVNVTNLCP
jgi:hypothetical protein